MTNRRDFLKTAVAVAAGACLAGKSMESIAAAPAGKKKIGLQLYSLRQAMQTDALGTLKIVAKQGWKELEPASYADGKMYNMTPKEIDKVCKDLGMKLVSAHIGGGMTYTKENGAKSLDWWKKAVEDHKEAGMSYVVQPSMGLNEKSSLAEYDVQCEYYNKIGEIAKNGGLFFGYHNHSGEFKQTEGKVIYDYLLAKTDPKLFFLEMDVYWAVKGGADPVKYFEKHPDRFPVLHIKDEKEIGASGTMDFESIFKAAYKNKLEAYFVEVERYDFDPIVSVQKSFDFLNNAAYVK